MKILVDVLRAEQTWDFNSKGQQNYLVMEALGVEIRVPCSQQQLLEAIARLPREEEGEEPMRNEPVAVNPPATFLDPEEPSAPELNPSLEAAPQRRLAPMKRQRGDDAGIAQG